MRALSASEVVVKGEATMTSEDLGVLGRVARARRLEAELRWQAAEERSLKREVRR